MNWSKLLVMQKAIHANLAWGTCEVFEKTGQLPCDVIYVFDVMSNVHIVLQLTEELDSQEDALY